jgi:RsiW-degrading membrane proteinase PrsW (M82 family)
MPDLHLLFGFVPVTLFLAALVFLDSFKLVHRSDVAKSLLAGAVAAGLSWASNVYLVDTLHVPPDILRKAVGPLVEETAKGALVVWLIRSGRVGFLVDAAIHGFAMGAGFALVENFYYVYTFQSADPGLWVVRGLGTAIMHGTTTAMFAILGKGLTGRRERSSLLWFLPGFLLAVGVHAGFNLFVLPPLVATGLLLAVMPILLGVVFERSERATRSWLGEGMERDVEALEEILSGGIVETRAGRYLSELRQRLPGAVVADMLCLLRVRLELSLRAKGLLMARSAGIELAPDPDVKANIEELRYLEHAIGAVGMLAIQPLVRGSGRWEQALLR